VSRILKKKKNVHCINFGGYNDFRFELMNFARLEDPSVVSDRLWFLDIPQCIKDSDVSLLARILNRAATSKLWR
jgi:hypothetical protein